VAVGAASAVYLLGPPLANSGPVFNAIGASAIVAILVGARRSAKKERLPWYLFALGQALFVTGDVLAYNYQRFFHRELPFPSVADIAYLAVYPCLVVGILVLIRRRAPGRDAASLIDSLIIATGAGVLSWVFLMAPYAHDGTLSLPTKLISIAYPLMDIVVLAVAVCLAVAPGKRETSFYLVTFSILALALTDSIYGWKLLHGGYETGGRLDAGWIAFYVFFAAAALHPSMRSLSLRVPDRPPSLTPLRLALLAAATLIGPAVQGALALLGRPIDAPVVAGSSVALVSLVVVRMAGLMRKQEHAQKLLTHIAFHDSLTGLANRALFADRVGCALERQLRSPDSTVAVLFLDLDDFKTVNDTFGHVAGDQLLHQVGARLARCLRTIDTSARLGGDEFAVLLDGIDNEIEAADVAKRMMAALEAPFELGDEIVTVRASVGIAFGGDRHGACSTEELLRKADFAMYTAKGHGKNRYEIFESERHVSVLERVQMKADLVRAVEDDQLRLHYQPLVVLGTGEVVGIEALVRWEHPERGLLLPADFIELAEETGAIVPLGRWVLQQACRDARELQLAYPTNVPLRVCVNVSMRQLQSPRLAVDVREALSHSGLSPSTLVLEITESTMMEDTQLSISRLNELKGIGLKLAVDDFGAGYSSLNYIRDFPVDIIKIDRSFIEGIRDEDRAKTVTETMIGLVRNLRLLSVAEGIEAPRQLSQMLNLHCDLGQGFYLGSPMTKDAIAELLSQQAQHRRSTATVVAFR
jgi:diguanylate cyclase (GGDEF)-like protein